MGNLQTAFATQPAYVGFLVAGDGGIEKTVQAAIALAKGGVNLLEIGIPFSDPVADGPVIQRAIKRSLDQDITPQDVFECIRQIKQHLSIPIVLYSYFNPILALKERFFLLAKQSGCDGILVVDLPFDEEKKFWEKCQQNALQTVSILTPNTPHERLLEIDKQCSGFLYYVCRKGTTGVRTELPLDFKQKIQLIKKTVKTPVVVGFGIGDRSTASQALEYADGFVVGSAFIQTLEEEKTFLELTQKAALIDATKTS